MYICKPFAIIASQPMSQKDLFGEGVSMQLHWGIRTAQEKRRVVNVLDDIVMISINHIVENGKLRLAIRGSHGMVKPINISI
jgi:hypothetical protein